MTSSSFKISPAHSEILWHFDPAASGPRRRAFVETSRGEAAVLVAYDDGRWAVDIPDRGPRYAASGVETGLALAQSRAFHAWLGLTPPI